MKSIAEARRASGTDSVGHSAVQAWSAGPVFPAVIAMVERYYDDEQDMGDGSCESVNAHVALTSRLKTRWWELTLDGRTEQYATREDAEMVAAALIRDPVLRARWNRRPARAARLCDEPTATEREHLQYLAACERSIREGVAS